MAVVMALEPKLARLTCTGTEVLGVTWAVGAVMAVIPASLLKMVNVNCVLGRLALLGKFGVGPVLIADFVPAIVE